VKNGKIRAEKESEEREVQEQKQCGEVQKQKQFGETVFRA
jgi:hypothetical protein